jgi:hypothetical protein
MAIRMMLSFFMTYGHGASAYGLGGVTPSPHLAVNLVIPRERLAPLPSGDAGGSGPAGNLMAYGACGAQAATI